MNSASAFPPPGTMPDLLHQTAFNLCATLACSWGGPVALRSENSFYAAELTLRLETLPQAGKHRHRPLLLWAGPSLADLPEVAGLLDAFPPESAVLLLFARQRTRAFVPDRPGIFRSARHIPQDLSCAMDGAVQAEIYWRTAGQEAILDWLAARGFYEEACYGIGGPEYRFWSRLAYLVERLGWADWADRFRARARAALLVKGDGAASAILALLLTVRRNG